LVIFLEAFVLANSKSINYMNGQKRTAIKIGAKVKIVLKQDQRSGKLTEGIVKDILTKSGHHPHGIKVRLQSGLVGRVKEIIDQEKDD
jgi:uncharacterized repeat protein (TIGR03833 family)